MIQTKKREFIPDESHKQNLPPYQHKLCASIWNISHIVSALQHCDLQTNDQYRTHSILFHFCWIFSEINISVRRSRISAKTSLPCFRRKKKSTGRISIGLGFSGLFDLFSVSTINFLFGELVIFLLFYHKCVAVGSGLTEGWYLMFGEPQQKCTAKSNRTE